MKKKEKIQILLMILIVCGMLLFLWLDEKDGGEGEKNRIARPESGSRNETIVLTFGDMSEERKLTVEAREKTSEEIAEAFAKTIVRLNEMLGIKDGEKAVLTENMELPRYLPETEVNIRWSSSDEEIVSREGIVFRERITQVQSVTLQARMTFFGEEREHWFEAEVLPYTPGSAETLFYEAWESLEEAEKSTAEEDTFLLPEEIGGVTVGLPEKQSVLPIVVLVAVVLLPFVLFTARRQEKEKERKRREEELLHAYPQLVTKLSLYTGAGLSLRGAWERMATEYRFGKEREGYKSAICEEVLLLTGELKNGTSEARAYEAFGRRIALKPYLRCASLMVSQLQKGSGGLRKGLENEVRMAWELQREFAAKKGEEAQTKLLFPMMGMLFLVMAVVMLPAFFSM